MIEEALVTRHPGRGGSLRGGPVEAQAVARPLRRFGARDIAALGADAISGEREAGRGDRREGIARPAIGREAALGIGRVPEIAEGPLAQLFRKGGLGQRGERRCGDGGGGRRARSAGGGQRDQGQDKDPAAERHEILQKLRRPAHGRGVQAGRPVSRSEREAGRKL